MLILSKNLADAFELKQCIPWHPEIFVRSAWRHDNILAYIATCLDPISPTLLNNIQNGLFLNSMLFKKKEADQCPVFNSPT